jgi:hypothetical protein
VRRELRRTPNIKKSTKAGADPSFLGGMAIPRGFERRSSRPVVVFGGVLGRVDSGLCVWTAVVAGEGWVTWLA